MFYGIFKPSLLLWIISMIFYTKMNFGVEYLGFHFSPFWALVDLGFIISLITT